MPVTSQNLNSTNEKALKILQKIEQYEGELDYFLQKFEEERLNFNNDDLIKLNKLDKMKELHLDSYMLWFKRNLHLTNIDDSQKQKVIEFQENLNIYKQYKKTLTKNLVSMYCKDSEPNLIYRFKNMNFSTIVGLNIVNISRNERKKEPLNLYDIPRKAVYNTNKFSKWSNLLHKNKAKYLKLNSVHKEIRDTYDMCSKFCNSFKNSKDAQEISSAYFNKVLKKHNFKSYDEFNKIFRNCSENQDKLRNFENKLTKIKVKREFYSILNEDSHILPKSSVFDISRRIVRPIRDFFKNL